MKLSFKILFSLAFLFIGTLFVFSQEEDEDQNPWEALLNVEVENPNPVYKPVIGLGVGWMTFLGDVNDNYTRLINGSPSYKLNVNTFLDKNHYQKLNFFGIYGSMQASHRDVTSTLEEDNLNFKSELFTLGVNYEYNFGNFFNQKKPRVRPFISLGVEAINFNSKGDFRDANGNYYNYWKDGTIRDFPETHPNAINAIEIYRDNVYETNLKAIYDERYGGTYQQIAVGFPVDFGFDFAITNRAVVRFATSLHITINDYFDNVTTEAHSINANLPENGRPDAFGFTYVTFHMDMFSSSETIEKRLLYLDIETDYDLVSDEDGDYVLDLVDECPDTPPRVLPDSVGCPLDDDNDGIPNYLDKELNSRKGMLVDDNGVEMTEEIAAAAYGEVDAVTADRAYMIPLTRSWTRYDSGDETLEMPQKFKPIDVDGDGYISFKEILGAIDKFFDDESGYEPDDIFELNEYFFAQ